MRTRSSQTARPLWATPLTCLLCLCLGACHEDENRDRATGYYIDAAVQGLYYEVDDSDGERLFGGTTGAEGNFRFPTDQGFTIRIFLGDAAADDPQRLVLNSRSLTQSQAQAYENSEVAALLITPYTGRSSSIAHAIAHFLQRLDQSTGPEIIEISASTHVDIREHSVISSRSIPLQASSNLVRRFESLLPSTTGSLSADEAMKRLQDNLGCHAAAVYSIDGNGSDADLYGAFALDSAARLRGRLFDGVADQADERELLVGERFFSASWLSLQLRGSDGNLLGSSAAERWDGRFNRELSRITPSATEPRNLTIRRADEGGDIFPEWRMAGHVQGTEVDSGQLLEFRLDGELLSGFLYLAANEDNPMRSITGERDTIADGDTVHRYSAQDSDDNRYSLTLHTPDQAFSRLSGTMTVPADTDNNMPEQRFSFEGQACRP